MRSSLPAPLKRFLSALDRPLTVPELVLKLEPDNDPNQPLHEALLLLHIGAVRFATWDAAILGAVDAMVKSFDAQGSHLADRTWGERNTTHIQHPLSLAVPVLGRWLDVPSRQLPGDQNMPRVQGPTFGASERMVVSPGHEETGLFEMPVGESGHPLSPYYQSGEMAWEQGKPAPFLPGPAVHRLHLLPR